MSAKIKKETLSAVFKSASTTLAGAGAIVKKLNDGADAMAFQQLQDEAKTLASVVIEDLQRDAGVEVVATDKGGEETPKFKAALEGGTEAVERLTAIVAKLKDADDMDQEAFDAIVKDYATVSQILVAVGSPVPAETTKSDDDEGTDAAAGTSEGGEGAGDGSAAATSGAGEGSGEASGTKPAAGSGGDSAAGDGAAATTDDAGSDTSAATSGEGGESTDSVETTAGDGGESSTASEGGTTDGSVEPPTPAEASAAANDLAIAAEQAALMAPPTTEAVEAVAKRFDDTFVRGGVSVDTGDMGTLKRVVEMIQRALSDEEDISKRASATLKAVGGEMRHFSKAIATAEKVSPEDLKFMAALKGMVVQAKEDLAKVAPTTGTIPDIAAQITAGVQAGIEAGLKPLKEALAKAAEDNKNLRTAMAKRDAEPGTPASSQEPGGGGGSQNTANLFPANYNQEKHTARG